MRQPLPLIAVLLLLALLLPRLEPAPRPALAAMPDCALRIDLAAQLEAGRQRLSAGALLTPDGASAADAFATVLACRPAHPEARTGLDMVLSLASERVRVLALGGGGELAAEWYDRARSAAERSTLVDYPAWAAFEAAALEATTQRIAVQGESARSALAPLLARLGARHPELAPPP
jgi:hypothetical protein